MPSSEKHSRTLLKAMSWRVFGTMWTFLAAWIITGSIQIGAGVGALDFVFKIGLYYVHERLWHRIKWGMTDEQVVDGGGI